MSSGIAIFAKYPQCAIMVLEKSEATWPLKDMEDTDFPPLFPDVY